MSSAINLKDQDVVAPECSLLSPLAQLIKEGLYLDKTMAIKQLYDGTDSRCDLIVRPRGFGKTIFADTLEALFTHDFKTLKGTEVEGKWNEPYVQVVRLNMAKISSIELENYPYYSLDDKGNKIMPVSAVNQEDIKRFAALPADDLYNFNSALYTLLFEQLTKGSGAVGDEREDFGAMISVTNERSSMGQINHLLSRCKSKSRVLIIENIDAPLLSSLHSPRLYNYRSRVLITFLNLVGYHRHIFRHIIVLGTSAIDYRQAKDDDYPPFMAYLPLKIESGLSREFGQLLGFSHKDLQSQQFAPFLKKACRNFNIKRKEQDPLAKAVLQEQYLDYLMHQYGGYAFDKFHIMCQSSAIYHVLKYGQESTEMLHALNFDYFKTSCRLGEMEMLCALLFLLIGRLVLIGEYCILPVLINDEDIVDPLGNAQDSNKSDQGDSLVLEENSQDHVNEVANEYESVAQLRRINDNEIVSQGMRGVPLAIFFWTLGYLSSSRMKEHELISTIPNLTVYDSLVNAIKQRYFSDKVCKDLSFKLDNKFFFPLNMRKLKNYFSKLVRGMKLHNFKEQVDLDFFNIMLSIWLIIQNKNGAAKALGLEFPTLEQSFAKTTEESSVLDGPTNSLESALFNAQEKQLSNKNTLQAILNEALKLQEQEQNSSDAVVVVEDDDDAVPSEDTKAHAANENVVVAPQELKSESSEPINTVESKDEDLSANFDELLGTLSELLAQEEDDVAPSTITTPISAEENDPERKVEPKSSHKIASVDLDDSIEEVNELLIDEEFAPEKAKSAPVVRPRREHKYNDKLNNFSNMAIDPHLEPSVRLRLNLQKLDRKSAERLWLNTFNAKAPAVIMNEAMRQHNYEVNKQIILDYRPYMKPNAQFKVLQKSSDSIQKRELLQCLSIYANSKDDISCSKRCDKLLAKMTDPLANDPNFAQGKDMHSLLLSQAKFIVENKNVFEANYLIMDLINVAKECCLLNTASKLLAQLDVVKDKFLSKQLTEREIVDLIDLETEEDVNNSLQDRAFKFINLPDSFTKTFMLRRFYFMAKEEYEIFLADLLDEEATKCRDLLLKEVLSDDQQTPMSLDDKLPVTLKGQDKRQQSPYYSYAINAESIGNTLSESEQLLLLLNHTSMMTNGEYLSGSLTDHCNLTIFNEDEALIFELGLATSNDDLAKIIERNYKALLKVRNPLEHLFDTSATSIMHYNTISLVAALNDDGCTLKDCTVVTDSKDSPLDSASEVVFESNNYYPNIKSILEQFFVFEQMRLGDVDSATDIDGELLQHHDDFVKQLKELYWGDVFKGLETTRRRPRRRRS